MSKGSDQLLFLLRERFPGVDITEEYTFSNGLRLDFYIPSLNIAFEYDGVQHQKYLDHFYSSKSEFYLAQNRDEQKEYICEGLGINLYRVSYEDELSMELIDDLCPSPGSGKILPEYRRFLNKKSRAKQQQKTTRKKAYHQYKSSDAYQEKKRKACEYRRQKYQELKSKLKEPQ
jgi:hypothetical protein